MIPTTNRSPFHTNAPSGEYAVKSNVQCDCCCENIRSNHLICVEAGRFTPESVSAVYHDLIDLHPNHEELAVIRWRGDGVVEFLFQEHPEEGDRDEDEGENPEDRVIH